MGILLDAGGVVDYASAKTADAAQFARLFHALLDEGVYIVPSPFEAGVVSLAHDDLALEKTRRAMVRAFERSADSRDA